MAVVRSVLLLGLLPLCTSLNCYLCTSGSTGCNDPFNAAGSGVSTTNSSLYTYCMVRPIPFFCYDLGLLHCVEGESGWSRCA